MFKMTCRCGLIVPASVLQYDRVRQQPKVRLGKGKMIENRKHHIKQHMPGTTRTALGERLHAGDLPPRCRPWRCWRGGSSGGGGQRGRLHWTKQLAAMLLQNLIWRIWIPFDLSRYMNYGRSIKIHECWLTSQEHELWLISQDTWTMVGLSSYMISDWSLDSRKPMSR